MENDFRNRYLSREITQRFIAVEGPIGVGKTTLARRLAKTLGFDSLLERAEENPFLSEFYQNRRNAALATQLFFLFQRSRQLEELRQQATQGCLVADFLLDKDRLFAQVNLDPREFELYEQVYRQLQPHNPTPDLVIYLQAPVPVLLERIEHRGVAAEQSISPRYLELLNEAYTQLFHYYDRSPVLIVNATDIDFANNDGDYLLLVDYLLRIERGRHYFNPTTSSNGN